MLSRRHFAALAVALSCAAALPVAAHDAPRVETEVALTEDGIVEITHVLQLSTAQNLLFKHGVISENDLSGLRSRAELALYTADRFDLMADDATLDLSLLGAEIEGGHIYVYQTADLDALPVSWSARNAILRDLNPNFDNMVNVPTPDGIRTIVFDDRDLDAVKSPR